MSNPKLSQIIVLILLVFLLVTLTIASLIFIKRVAIPKLIQKGEFARQIEEESFSKTITNSDPRYKNLIEKSRYMIHIRMEPFLNYQYPAIKTSRIDLSTRQFPK